MIDDNWVFEPGQSFYKNPEFDSLAKDYVYNIDTIMEDAFIVVRIHAETHDSTKLLFNKELFKQIMMRSPS